MHLERTRPYQVEVTLHPYELAALVAAARWVLDGANGELPTEALDQLQQVVDNYDKANQTQDS